MEHPDDSVSQRVRQPGGGRTSALEHGPPLKDHFLRLLAEFTAGDPMREGVLWTNLSRREISRRLREMGTPASRHTVRKLMKKHHLGQRKVRKKKALGAHPDRDAQFQNIAKLQAEYRAAGGSGHQHRHQEKGIDREFCPRGAYPYAGAGGGAGP